MNRSYFREGKKRGRSGFAGLLILLLGVGILAFLYLAYMGAFNPFSVFQGTERDRYSDPNAYPWEEGHLFVFEALDGYDMGGRRPPFSAQPRLTSLLQYSGAVYIGDNKYGQLEMMISDDGDARAQWSGDFRIEGKHYQAVEPQKSVARREMHNMFWGNTAPLKVYEDENGKDKSKLYVITEGLFHLKCLSDESSLEGTAYVTCWIDKDYKAVGKLSIPLFAGEQTLIFNWGPVWPIKE